MRCVTCGGSTPHNICPDTGGEVSQSWESSLDDATQERVACALVREHRVSIEAARHQVATGRWDTHPVAMAPPPAPKKRKTSMSLPEDVIAILREQPNGSLYVSELVRQDQARKRLALAQLKA